MRNKKGNNLLVSKKELEKIIEKIAYDIDKLVSKNDQIAMIGIKTRGEPLAIRIKEIIKKTNPKREVFLGHIDIGEHRDDFRKPNLIPPSRDTKIDFDIQNKSLFVIDDVFNTARTARAAIDTILEYGRPSRIWLAVLIDRGHRELPFIPDISGKNIPTSKNEHILVKLKETDGEDSIWLLQNHLSKSSS